MSVLQSLKENKIKRNVAEKTRIALVAGDDPLKDLPFEGIEVPITPMNDGINSDRSLLI